MWSSRNRMITDNDGDDVAFLSGSGDSRHGLYNNGGGKKALYEGGHVAQCTKIQAIAILIFVFTAIFLTSLAVAFVRPFNVCPPDGTLEPEASEPEELELIATNGEDFPWDDIRLPQFIKPIRYDIELTPNLTTKWVKGIEKLIFTVSEETNFIVFHSKNITITSRTINERLKVERMLEFPAREQIYLEMGDIMTPGVTYAVRIKFQYKLSENLEGFYISSYKDKDGNERVLATSHFEPTYARRAFPCFDEPALKAKFLMTITHDKNMTAFFNTPKKAVNPVRGKSKQIRDEFAETVDMSTYLVAFVVCDFDSISDATQKNINVSVIASKDKIGQAKFALDAATRIMDFYDEFFGVPYPLPKQDLIAIPDFGAGAMENWGLITYRETSLLYSPEETSVDSKQWVAVVVAHELAHQWFGNLVTMMWWNDLWLNEGFASWMEYRTELIRTFALGQLFSFIMAADLLHMDYSQSTQFFVLTTLGAIMNVLEKFRAGDKQHGGLVGASVRTGGSASAVVTNLPDAVIHYLVEGCTDNRQSILGMFLSGVDHIEPEWRMMDQFYFDMVVPALDLDSLSNSHPVSVSVHDPKEIEAIFDAISYKKGAAIVHMLEDTLGEAVVRKGLRKYLNAHEFGNAETGDLWRAISEAEAEEKKQNSNFTVSEMMDTWTLQMGYPMITFKRINDTNRFSVGQERFLKAMNLKNSSIERLHDDGSEYTWIVPVTFRTDLDDFPVQHMFLNKTDAVEIELPGDLKWYKANLNGTGYYRVNYPVENWDALILQLQEDHEVFTAADRAQLINDAFSLSQAGLLPASKPLGLCLYLLKETEVVPWASALRHLGSWKLLLRETDLVPKINGLIRHLISPIYNKLGWEDEGTHLEKLLRKLVLLNAVNADMPEAKIKALELFANLRSPTNSIPVKPNLRWMVYSAGIKFGSVEDWKFAWDKYVGSRQVPSEKSLWMRAMAVSQDTYVLQRYLAASLDRDKIRPQDTTSVVSGVAHNLAGAHLAWRHLQVNWEKLVEKFGGGSFTMGSLIESTISHFSTEFDLAEVQSFFKSRQVGSGLRALAQGLEQIRINIQWRSDHEQQIRTFINSKVLGENEEEVAAPL